MYMNLIEVSVPIRGLFNLTTKLIKNSPYSATNRVSVPIRGLFNLTKNRKASTYI